MQPLKLVVIGPVRCGKTIISNFLADATELSYDYHPTQGVRILEFDVHDIEIKNKNVSRDIELWDCSGDHKFENCWAVMRKGLHGVILVYSTKIPNCLKEIQMFYNYFVEQTKIGPERCVIFCFDPENNAEISREISSTFARVSHLRCNTDSGGNKLKTDFHSFISTLLNKMHNFTHIVEKNGTSNNIPFSV